MARKRANYKQLAEALDEAARNGNPVRDVLLANGYSQSVANQGWDAVPNRALKLMKGHSKGKRFRELGKSLPVSERGAFSLLHSFNGSDGVAPLGEPLLNTKGTLFGVAVQGGTYGAGTVWEYVP